MSCPKCGCKTMLELPCGSASYGGGEVNGVATVKSHTISYYQCVDCGHVEKYEHHHEGRYRVTYRMTKYGGLVRELEPIEEQDNQ